MESLECGCPAINLIMTLHLRIDRSSPCQERKRGERGSIRSGTTMMIMIGILNFFDIDCVFDYLVLHDMI